MSRTRLFQIALTAVVTIGILDVLLPLLDFQGSLERYQETMRATAVLYGASPALTTGTSGAPGVVLGMVLGTVCAALALALVWRAHDRPYARALALFFAAWSAPSGVLIAIGADPVLVLRYGMAVQLLALAMFVRFSTLFPEPLTVERLRSSRMVRGRPARAWRRLFWRAQEAMLRPGPVWTVAAAMALAVMVTPAGRRMTGVIVLVGIPALYLMIRGVRHLRLSFRSADADGRRRVLWMVAGFNTALWLFVFGQMLGMVQGGLAGFRAGHSGTELESIPLAFGTLQVVFTMLPYLAIAFATAVAVFYQGAIDPAVVIRRSTVAGVLGVIFPFLFAGIENAVSSYVSARLGLPEMTGSVIAGGTLALTFHPARNWITRVLERRLGAADQAPADQAAAVQDVAPVAAR